MIPSAQTLSAFKSSQKPFVAPSVVEKKPFVAHSAIEINSPRVSFALEFGESLRDKMWSLYLKERIFSFAVCCSISIPVLLEVCWPAV